MNNTKPAKITRSNKIHPILHMDTYSNKVTNNTIEPAICSNPTVGRYSAAGEFSMVINSTRQTTAPNIINQSRYFTTGLLQRVDDLGIQLHIIQVASHLGQVSRFFGTGCRLRFHF